MALATPPDLAGAEHPIQPLARAYPRGHITDPHVHDWGQLLHAESGVMWVDTPTAALLVPPNRAVWIPPHLHHGMRVVSDLEMRNIYLYGELATQIGSSLAVVEVSPLLRELITRRVSLGQDFDESHREALEGLLVIEQRLSRTAPLQVPMPANGDRRLRSLCEDVLRSPSLETSFEQHAQAVGASTRTLARLLNIELGQSFTDWRRQVQLAYASGRLLDGEAVSSVAAELGFSLSSFSEMFRRAVGIAPSVYASSPREVKRNCLIDVNIWQVQKIGAP